MGGIRSPQPDFTGEVARVRFVDGHAVGLASDAELLSPVAQARVLTAALGYFRRHGYTIDLIGEDLDQVHDVPARPAKGDKVASWRAYATAIHPDRADEIAKTGKPQLIELYGSEPGEDLVESVEGSTPVGAEVPGVDLGTDPDQVGAVPADVTPGQDDANGDLDGHGA